MEIGQASRLYHRIIKDYPGSQVATMVEGNAKAQ